MALSENERKAVGEIVEAAVAKGLLAHFSACPQMTNIETLFRKAEAHTTRLALASAQAGVDVLCFYDDAGMQSGMQIAPGLYKLVDLPDLQGLLAPRPLLIDIGANDSCFKVDTAMACFKKLEKIYAAAKASKNLQLDLFPGEHGWGANKSKEFFSRHLK